MIGEPYDTDYLMCPVSATTALEGSTGSGKQKDIIETLLLIPANLSPGAVSIKDGGDAASQIFAGGAASLTELRPISIQLGARSRTGKWQIVTGADITVLATGRFS